MSNLLMHLRYGPPREAVTNGVTYAPITATFICSYEMFEKRWFEAWQNSQWILIVGNLIIIKIIQVI